MPEWEPAADRGLWALRDTRLSSPAKMRKKCCYGQRNFRSICSSLSPSYLCDKLSIIWKSDLTDKMKRSFFQAVVVSILLYGCTTWTLTKRLEKKLDGNYTRMLRAILNKSWRQHPTRHQLYGHLPPITKTIQVRRTRHAGHCWRNRDEWCTLMEPHIWPCKSRTSSTNIHSATMWGYGM